MSDSLKLRARMPAPIDAVRRALTEPEQLRTWFAEHAEVELPDRYEFWGRYTPEGDAPHQRLLHADDTTLRFAWLLDGVETTSEIELERESETTTVIALSQSHFSFEEALSGTTIRGILQTFWGLAIANLVDHLEGRPLTARVDLTSPTLQTTVEIDAPADAIFESLVDGEQVTRWFGYPIEIEARDGGRYAMGSLDAPHHMAQIVAFEPGSKVSVDWGGAGVTTWELEGSGGATRLTMVQSGFAGQPPYTAWSGNLSGLAELRRYHDQGGDWRPIWIQEGAAAA